MKTIFFLLSLIFVLPITMHAQRLDLLAYGEPSLEEIQMKECVFDKDANAIILLHEAVSDYDDNYQLVTNHHFRIKILDKKGIDAANIKIRYWLKDDFEKIYDVEGLTINPGENDKLEKIKLDKKSIYKQKLSKRVGEVSFAFPSVSEGSIIEYRYQSVMKHYGGLDEWLFQDELPVLKSTYKLYIVPNAEFAYRVSKREDIPVVIKPGNESAMVYFEMVNIPGLGHEPYMDARNDYLQKIIFQLSGYNYRNQGKSNFMNSWDEVTRELMNDTYFGLQLTKNVPGTSDFIKEVENLPADGKMKMIYDYVRNNITWNGLYSRYASDGIKATWQDRKGASGAINLLLVNLLKEAGLEGYPVLVSERFHGKVNADYPFIDQFNSTFACVIIINDKKYFLDTTDKFTPAHLIPYDILNTTAFIVNKKRGGLINISNDSVKYTDEILTKINVNESGKMSGEVLVKSTNYARVKRLTEYTQDKDDFMASYFRKNIDVTTKDFKIENADRDSLPLEQSCNFDLNAGSDGNYSYIPLAVFSGFNNNPFIPTTRFSNINFGYKRTIRLRTVISYDEKYTVDATPKKITMTNPENDIIITRQVDSDPSARLIYASIILEFKNSLYTPDDYPILQELYKKMYSMLKEPVVLKKK